MKIYFYAGITIIAVFIATLLGYGVYLNQRGENQITELIEKNRLPLVGAVAKVRTLSPTLDIELINLYSDDMTDVVALTEGRIVNEYVEKNSHVKPGSVILTLVDENLPLKMRQVESDILEAEAQFLQAKNSYDRYRELKSVNAISLEKFDEAEAMYRSAKARLAHRKAQQEQLSVQIGRQTVTSPIEGEVLTLYHKIGSYVTPGTAVALVGNFHRLKFTSSVADTRRISVGQISILTVNGNEALQKSYGAEYKGGNLGGEQIFSARIIKITPDLSEPAAVRQVVWEVDNSSGILEPGIYSKIKMQPDFKFNCLTIPLTALTDELRNMVAVVDENGALRMKKIETGESDGTYVEVLSGLSEGDVVITSDTRGLKEGMPIELTVEEGNE